MLQGWRWELISIASTLISLEVVKSKSLIAYYVCIGFLVALLVIPTALRTHILSALRRRRIERYVHHALWGSDVVGRQGVPPRVVAIQSLATGWIVRLNLPIGLHLKELERRLPEIEVAMDARSVRVKSWQGSSRLVEMSITISSAFDTPLTSPLLSGRAISLWDPILVGKSEDGQPVWLKLVEHNLLVGGEPGSGKSVALSALVGAVALDPNAELTILDGKQVELSAWSGCARKFIGPSQAEAVAAMQELLEIMNERYEMLSSARKRKIDQHSGVGIHVVVIDELAFYLRGGEKHLRERFAELLRDLVSRGRAAGIVVVAATQKPSHEVVPTFIRDLFSYRMAMRCTSPDASDTILGQGWASLGYSASKIDSASRGLGYLLSEGSEPVLLLTAFLTDEEIDEVSFIAEEARSRVELGEP